MRNSPAVWRGTFCSGVFAVLSYLQTFLMRPRWDGSALKKKWEAGPRTYLGLMSEGFPNMFMITGPGSPSVKGNIMNSIEQHVELVTDALIHMREQGLETIEPELDAENEWVDHVQDVAHKTLFPLANSWYMGANIPGTPHLFMPYIAGVGSYCRTCEEIVANDYRGFHFEAVATQSPESTMRPILAPAVNRPLSY